MEKLSGTTFFRTVFKIKKSCIDKINCEDLIRFGNDKAKLSSNLLDSLSQKDEGKLILVTAISPTPAGEGKTTTSVGLVDGLCKIGKKAMICLREPSLGPCFGMKGGAAGGGQQLSGHQCEWQCRDEWW